MGFLKHGTYGKHHQGKLVTILNSLFNEFPIASVIKKLMDHQILNALTQFDEKTLKQLNQISLDSIESNSRALNTTQQRERYYFTLTAYYLVTHGKKKLEKWPFYLIAKHLPVLSRGYYDYLQHKICGKAIDTYYHCPNLDAVIEKVQELVEPTEELSAIAALHL